MITGWHDVFLHVFIFFTFLCHGSLSHSPSSSSLLFLIFALLHPPSHPALSSSSFFPFCSSFFLYLLCHPLWVVWLLFCCLLISRPDPSFPARSFLFLLPLFSTLLSAFSSCTALPIRCIVSFGLLVSGCGSQSDWVSACWASFSSLCSLTQHKAKVSITAILLSTQEPTIPVHHTGPKQSFLYTAMKFPNDTPQGKPELSNRVLNCQDLHMYRFSPV